MIILRIHYIEMLWIEYRMRRNCLEYIYRFVWKISEKTDKTPFGVFAISAAALIYFRASAAALWGEQCREDVRAAALVTDVVRAAALIFINIGYFKQVA